MAALVLTLCVICGFTTSAVTKEKTASETSIVDRAIPANANNEENEQKPFLHYIFDDDGIREVSEDEFQAFSTTAENVSDEDTPMVISADSVQIVDMSTIADDENMPMFSRNMVTENIPDEDTPMVISADSEIGRNIRIVDLSTIADDENMPMFSRNMVTENISDEDMPIE